MRLTSLAFAEDYFRTARERYEIMQRRRSGESPPWSQDPIFQNWRFCNVHREDDKTTEWFRKNIRDELSGYDVVQATVIFRWFNKIETAERILDLILGEWDWEEAQLRLQGVNPVTTGAYMINTPPGYSKLDGVLVCIQNAIPELKRITPLLGESLEDAWKYIHTIDRMGRFMAYEVVTDLRWTDVLRDANDILLWASAGPGCARGLSRVVDGSTNLFTYNSTSSQRDMLQLMQTLLALSHDSNYWPQDYPPWEMREVEHWACEYDKYKRAEAGSRLKRRYP